MNDYNKIRLLHDKARLTRFELMKFSKLDLIYGNNSAPETIKEWDASQKEEALAELAKYRCTYDIGYDADIEEYALEYYRVDEEGEFESGSDYDPAEQAMWYAARYDDEWSWDNGSYDYDEAVELAMNEEYKQIAVIDTFANMCEKEIDLNED